MTKHVAIVDFLSPETSSLVMTEHITIVGFVFLQSSIVKFFSVQRRMETQSSDQCV
jgi:hypothetical protein